MYHNVLKYIIICIFFVYNFQSEYIKPKNCYLNFPFTHFQWKKSAEIPSNGWPGIQGSD